MKRHFLYAGSKVPTFLNAKPWKSQAAFNTAAASSFGTWGTTAPTGLTVRSRGAAFVTKGYVYYVGGYSTAAALVSTTQYAPLSSGVPGTFVAGTSYPIVVLGPVCLLTRNRVHILGGYSPNVSTITNAVYSASVDPITGLLGSWSAGNNLVAACSRFGVAVNHPYVYMFGGIVNVGSNTPTANIYRATINDDGTIGTWSLYGTMPSARMDHNVLENDQYIFICGGGSNGSGNAGTSWWYYPKNSDGSLGTVQNFTGSHAMAAGITYLTADYMFTMAGQDATFTYQSAVYRSPITSGLPGSWTALTSLPANAAGGANFGHVITAAQAIILSSTSAAAASTAQYLSATFSGGLDDYLDKSFILN